MQTSINPKAFARLTFLTIFGLLFALLIPAQSVPAQGGLLLVVTVMFGGTVWTLTSMAAARRQRLMDAVRLELNKLRRLYHVSKNLSGISAEYRPWFTDLHGHIYKYLTEFTNKDFDAYDAHNKFFREISYHVYTIPPIQGVKEQSLFEDLLRTTATVAEARQQIKELWDNRLSFHVWLMVLLGAAMLFVAVSQTMPGDPASRLVGGCGLAAALLALDYLWKTDSLASEKASLPKRYVENLAKFELGRRD